LTSTALVPAEPATWRRPLTSTRVRLDPRLRRFRVARPWPDTELVVLEAEEPRPTCGWRVMASIRLVTPVFSISWASTTLTGVAVRTPDTRAGHHDIGDGAGFRLGGRRFGLSPGRLGGGGGRDGQTGDYRPGLQIRRQSHWITPRFLI